jgi:hypothetical protein
MNSETELANQALSLIRRSIRIEDINDSNSNSIAGLCKTFLDSCRKEALEKHDWNFARNTKRLTPVEVPEEDADANFPYGFSKPPGFIIARKAENGAFFRVSGNFIFSDYADMTLTFTKDIGLSYAPAYFTNMLAVFLASKIAMPILNSTSRAKEIERKYFMQRTEAHQTDSVYGTDDNTQIYDSDAVFYTWDSSAYR